MSRKEVAEHAVIPAHFLAKIAQELAKTGMIEIRQGARGGFILLMDPGEITLLQVIEIVIGEIFLNDCVIRPQSCEVSTDCSVHNVWMTARDQLRNTLGGVTFAELINQPVCISERPEVARGEGGRR